MVQRYLCFLFSLYAFTSFSNDIALKVVDKQILRDGVVEVFFARIDGQPITIERGDYVEIRYKKKRKLRIHSARIYAVSALIKAPHNDSVEQIAITVVQSEGHGHQSKVINKAEIEDTGFFLEIVPAGVHEKFEGERSFVFIAAGEASNRAKGIITTLSDNQRKHTLMIHSIRQGSFVLHEEFWQTLGTHYIKYETGAGIPRITSIQAHDPSYFEPIVNHPDYGPDALYVISGTTFDLGRESFEGAIRQQLTDLGVPNDNIVCSTWLKKEGI